MSPCCSGEFLSVGAAVLASQLASGRSVQSISVLAGFFTSLGDNLALIAAAQAESTAGQDTNSSGCTSANK